MAEATTEVEQLASDFMALWDGDFSKLDAVADSFVMRSPALPEGEARGRETLEERIKAIHSGFPDFHMSRDDMLASDEIIMIEWTMSGTHEGQYLGVPPTHLEMEVSGMSKILISDDKVQEDRIYFDTREIFEQLGLTED